MGDMRTAFSQDGNDGSYSFGFQFDNGEGLLLNRTIDVTAKEAPDLETAKNISLQKAADAKEAWLDSIAKADLIGPIELPMSTKAKAAKSDAGGAEPAVKG